MHNNDKDHTCQWKANNNYCEFYNCNLFHHKEPLILLQTMKNTREGVLFLVKTPRFFTFCNNTDGSSQITFDFVMHLD